MILEQAADFERTGVGPAQTSAGLSDAVLICQSFAAAYVQSALAQPTVGLTSGSMAASEVPITTLPDLGSASWQIQPRPCKRLPIRSQPVGTDLLDAGDPVRRQWLAKLIKPSAGDLAGPLDLELIPQTFVCSLFILHESAPHRSGGKQPECCTQDAEPRRRCEQKPAAHRSCHQDATRRKHDLIWAS